jgi:hypothetical protein
MSSLRVSSAHPALLRNTLLFCAVLCCSALCCAVLMPPPPPHHHHPTHAPPPPRYLVGLRPCVAAELSSALLLLHDIRADQCEVSLVPGVNTHVQHGYRGYWALSVLAGMAAWLGPGFKMSWQALAVVNDMMVALVERLCQVGVGSCLPLGRFCLKIHYVCAVGLWIPFWCKHNGVLWQLVGGCGRR